MLNKDVILFIIKYLTLPNTGVTTKDKSSETTVRNVFQIPGTLYSFTLISIFAKTFKYRDRKELSLCHKL